MRTRNAEVANRGNCKRREGMYVCSMRKIYFPAVLSMYVILNNNYSVGMRRKISARQRNHTIVKKFLLSPPPYLERSILIKTDLS